VEVGVPLTANDLRIRALHRANLSGHAFASWTGCHDTDHSESPGAERSPGSVEDWTFAGRHLVLAMNYTSGRRTPRPRMIVVRTLPTRRFIIGGIDTPQYDPCAKRHCAIHAGPFRQSREGRALVVSDHHFGTAASNLWHALVRSQGRIFFLVISFPRDRNPDSFTI
jgi:hypothetical protein